MTAISWQTMSSTSGSITKVNVHQLKRQKDNITTQDLNWLILVVVYEGLGIVICQQEIILFSGLSLCVVDPPKYYTSTQIASIGSIVPPNISESFCFILVISIKSLARFWNGKRQKQINPEISCESSERGWTGCHTSFRNLKRVSFRGRDIREGRKPVVRTEIIATRTRKKV
jgi:hypothetical protein